ncbi:MAG: cell division protein FtsL [Chromatiales bacterium]|nr:cell division protein FtsL [Chromatiales bacterium]
MTWRVMLPSLLALLVLASAVGVVATKHQSRKLFVELERLTVERDELNIDWGRLQLEQSTWSTHGRIEQVAHERLQMRLPGAAEIRIVVPDSGR